MGTAVEKHCSDCGKTVVSGYYIDGSGIIRCPVCFEKAFPANPLVQPLFPQLTEERVRQIVREELAKVNAETTTNAIKRGKW